MGKQDERVGQYIDNSADFAKPILIHLRNLVHQACPEVSETIKWKFPVFEYNNSILCSMASFKQHCTFGFWKGAMLSDPHKVLNPVGDSAMGQFGRLTHLSSLPSDEVIIAYLREAMALTEISDQPQAKKVAEKKEVEVPAYFQDALLNNPKAKEVFDKFPPSHKKEYVMWITEAKTVATREKRIETALEWIAEGKQRNWKYIK
jgi:uncharacterized protein YdeI (YjbR/CyaY-like superfamily)